MHLKTTMDEHYTVAMDWNGSLFCGVNINWDYPACIITLNMPNYILKVLVKFQHTTPKSPQRQLYMPIPYGADVQRVDVDTSAPLSPNAIKYAQDIIGRLLYYGRAVNPTLITALNSITTQQANTTNPVVESCQQLLDDCHRPWH
jgi:hypothetical protein